MIALIYHINPYLCTLSKPADMLGLSVMHFVPVLPSPLGWESAGNLPNSVTRKLMKTNKAEACCEHLHTLTLHMLDTVLGNYIGYNIL